MELSVDHLTLFCLYNIISKIIAKANACKAHIASTSTNELHVSGGKQIRIYSYNMRPVTRLQRFH